MKSEILKLRELGYSYTDIATSLKCSKSTVCYYLGDNQPHKRMLRTRRNRAKEHPYNRKLSRFQHESNPLSQRKNRIKSIQKMIYNKLWSFTRGLPMITLDDVMSKFGNQPVCYLTGAPIDISQPKTYEFDHIIPISRGGDNSIDNLGICTKTVNRAKGNMTNDEFLALCLSVVKHSKGESNP